MSSSGYPPPPGGFGGQGPPPNWGPQAPRPSSSGATGAVIALVVVGGLVAGIGILAVLAIFGVRKYIANAKTAEARVSLSMIGKDAVAAYEAEPLEGSWATSAASPGSDARPKHGLCKSTDPVPRDLSFVSAKKYQSSNDDWASWKCLKFEMIAPQYYQYRYESTGVGFNAIARGDLDGDGMPSKFELEGRVQGDTLVVDPTISETDPDE